MPKRPTVSSISRARAEADFATWSMMAGLGSLGELPPDAQNHLASYQERLKSMPEQAAAAATVDEIDAAYQEQMKHARGRFEQRDAELDEAADVVGIEEGQRIRAARRAAARHSPRERRPLPAWMIFAGLIILVVVYRLASGFWANPAP